jgi:hypothetical protein
MTKRSRTPKRRERQVDVEQRVIEAIEQDLFGWLDFRGTSRDARLVTQGLMVIALELRRGLEKLPHDGPVLSGIHHAATKDLDGTLCGSANDGDCWLNPMHVQKHPNEVTCPACRNVMGAPPLHSHARKEK